MAASLVQPFVIRLLSFVYNRDMSTEMNKLYQDILKLPDDERAEMAASLIDSLDNVIDSAVEASWESEIQRRLSDFNNGSVSTVPWPDARRLILKDAD